MWKPALTTLWLVVLIGAGLLEARGQTTARADVFGSAGLQALWDDESSLGTGSSAGGGLGVVFGDRLVVRGRVVRTNNERDFGNGVVFDAATTRYTADALWRLSSSEHAAFVGVGVGGLSFTRTSQFPPEGATVFSRSDTDFVFGGIGGFTAFTRGRFALRPEASFWWSQPNNFIGIEFSVLASVGF
jgi:hypothetical protein